MLNRERNAVTGEWLGRFRAGLQAEKSNPNCPLLRPFFSPTSRGKLRVNDTKALRSREAE
jgi:hypothetical protein